LKITVIIPVKNGAQTLERCLVSIRNQTVKEVDIIILDSMSTDNSNAIALQYDATIIAVVEGSFNHGLTRNLGVQYATGAFLFYTVQDAWLAENTLFEKMLGHFENEAVMAVSGHQAVPHEMDKNPLKWYKRFSEPVTVIRQLKDATGFDKMNHGAQQSLIAWDNVIAMYRREALLQLPFISTEMSEDWVWSRDALLKGWKLVYDPSLLVYHYHHDTYHYVYQVTYSVNYHFYRYFGFIPTVPAVIPLMVRATWHLAKNRELGFFKKLYWVFHNYKSIIARTNSTLNILFYLKTGGLDAISKRYTRVCKTIPQGKQKARDIMFKNNPEYSENN